MAPATAPSTSSSSAPAPSTSPPSPSPVAVRPFEERLRDSALAAGALGSFVGACLAARHERSLISGVAWPGASAALLVAAFIGLREAQLQGRWEEDREGVSGLAAGVIGCAIFSKTHGAKAGARAGLAGMFGGAALHYAHRWWLHARLRRDVRTE